MRIAGLVIIIFSLLAACGEEDDENRHANHAPSKEETAVFEKQPPSKVKSVTDTPQQGEKTFYDLFKETDIEQHQLSYVREYKSDIINKLGSPEESGWYEGAEFIQFRHGTYFINPDTNKATAVAVQNPGLEQADIKKWLGPPDETFENAMEGLWTQQYVYKDGSIVVEKTNEDASAIMCIWYQSNERENQAAFPPS
ncbi:hypothetical protein [Salibacterium aidingense]|uniref:hypothetical protein n=1 Tax=Salibacterium aidingense TaxID=384933 RepID=UPI0004017052|nr:hypothetical protein [Salibacterium aidingense]